MRKNSRFFSQNIRLNSFIFSTTHPLSTDRKPQVENNHDQVVILREKVDSMTKIDHTDLLILNTKKDRSGNS